MKKLQIFTVLSILVLTNYAPAALSQERGFAGQYLSSHFAQNQNDWKTANYFLNQILQDRQSDPELIRRSMVLAMGSGDLALAAQRAESLIKQQDKDISLPLMILAVNDMVNDRPQDVSTHLAQMPPGDITDFVTPILVGWAAAAQGHLETEKLNETAIHQYHGALLATFLNKKKEMTAFTQNMLNSGTLSNGDAERTADMLATLERYEEAALLYKGIYLQDESNKRLSQKMDEAGKGSNGNIRELVTPLKIKSAGQGAALAMYDMATLLYQEHSDSSTRLFSHMALALDPTITDAHLLLADTLTRNGRLEEAIEQLGKIPVNHPSYLAVQRHAADLLAEMGYKEEALAKLNQLFTEQNDVESLIKIGDLYRQNEDFYDALKAYNRAASYIGSQIPEEYWYLLYARGMTYERQGEWNKAESDLKAALVYRPDHPYLLNYLGYGWADQGLNLDQSLELIKRAVSLRPTDGYIIDSLGWVQYMMGDYQGSIPNLERAVELLPYDSTINDHLGDAYWQTGRATEAKFQWERALNYSEENTSKDILKHKLRFGLEGMEELKKATAE